MYYLQQSIEGRAPEYEVTARVETSIPLCRELFRDELRVGLNILDCRGFVSYKDVGKLGPFVLHPLNCLLELFYEADPEIELRVES